MAKSKTSTSKKKSSAKSVKTAAKPKKAPRSVQMAPPPEPPQPIHRELTGLLFLLLAVFLGISLFNNEGTLIVYVSNFIKGMVGWGFWLAVPVFLFIALILFFHGGRPVEGRVFAALMLPILFGAMVHLLLGDPATEDFDLSLQTGILFADGQQLQSGGTLGGLIAIGLTKALSAYGAWPLLIVLFILCLILTLRGTLSGVRRKIAEAPVYSAAAAIVRGQESVTVPELGDEDTGLAPRTVRRGKDRIERYDSSAFNLPLGEDDDALSLAGPAEEEPVKTPVKPKRAPVRRKKKEDEEPSAPYTTKEAPEIAGQEVVDDFHILKDIGKKTEKPTVTVSTEIADPPKAKKMKPEEIASEAAAMANAIAAGGSAGEEYRFPPTDLLRTSSAAAADSRDEIQTNRERLEGALHSFGISSAIVGVTRGPTVTRYDIELEQGVKLSRVTNLAGDLALALGVVNVRIAPIPDKISTVGIEVPNRLVSTVYLRDILESPRFQSAKSKLSFALGKDIGGECIVGNIAKLPHMLIAGTTGSGKSVCMNSLILSLLYKARPDEVRLIMIDPKMVELGVYNGIPHLYVPVVTDPKKAAGALQWSVVEMLKRYRSFSEVGVRDLESYNKHCRAAGEPTLPAVVIVIDELADLMLVASKEVEESICRVAQMGRAAGMHLVIATQRPSADVITGLMKANIPSRIAFAVSSSLESRIILDQTGAEKLVGMGDMLFSPVGLGKPVRIQGAFVSDEEREDVIQFIKENTSEPELNQDLRDMMEKAAEDKGAADAKGAAKDEDGAAATGYDEMLPQAAEVVLEMGSCSVSMLQRRLKLGYSRAARIVDQMEELGIVGPYEGAKPRSVPIDRAGWQALQVKLGLASADEFALAAEMNADTPPYESEEE
ncbi:MAG: DNA translocase FtsK [Eubacteriales bacterium]|nr:DNA translocase FtsK [Eubacteriales bacterium]